MEEDTEEVTIIRLFLYFNLKILRMIKSAHIGKLYGKGPNKL